MIEATAEKLPLERELSHVPPGHKRHDQTALESDTAHPGRQGDSACGLTSGGIRDIKALFSQVREEEDRR